MDPTQVDGAPPSRLCPGGSGRRCHVLVVPHQRQQDVGRGNRGCARQTHLPLSRLQRAQPDDPGLALTVPAAGMNWEDRQAMLAALEELIGDRRRQPRTDLISQLSTARAGPAMSDEELLSMCELLVTAAVEPVGRLSVCLRSDAD